MAVSHRAETATDRDAGYKRIREILEAILSEHGDNERRTPHGVMPSLVKILARCHKTMATIVGGQRRTVDTRGVFSAIIDIDTFI